MKINLSKDFTCEFCGMQYPENPSDKVHPLGYHYYKIKCRSMLIPHDEFKEHIICKDCYDRLEEI